jgi:diguanylate cyclase (GGDEF)-like protein
VDLEHCVYVKSVVQASLDDVTEQFMTNRLIRVKNLRSKLKVMHGAILIAIIGIGGFVFAPLFRRVVKQSETLVDAAQRHPLNGGLNRQGFLTLGPSEFIGAPRYRTAMNVIVLHINYFKNINDSLGHAAGDQEIRSLTEAYMRTLRKSDAYGRLGGEEVGILLPETHLAEAPEIEKNQRELLANSQGVRDRSEIRFAASSGVTKRKVTDGSLEAMLNRAAVRMFVAKNAGRSRVVLDEKEAAAYAAKSMTDILDHDQPVLKH